MKKSDLEKLEIGEDAIKEILKLNGLAIEAKKTELETATTELDTLKKQLAEANTTIESFKDVDVDAIKATADDYKAKFEASETSAKEAMATVKYNHALDNALTAAKVVNSKAVRALLNTETIILDEKGKLVGFDEQVAALKESDPNQFTPETPLPKIVAGTQKHSIVGGDVFADAARKGAGLAAAE